MKEPSNPTPPVTVVVLAAGASSRMGEHKLLLPLGGRPLVAWSVAAASDSKASDVWVILGRDAASIEAMLPPGRYRTIRNAVYSRGQSASLALAASAAPAGSVGIIVLLADQPFVTAELIDHVLAAVSESPDRVIMCTAHGHQGHPVYLPRRLFAALQTLTGDIGARDLIASEHDSVRLVATEDNWAQFDVDTPEDYQVALSLAYRLTSSEP
ncbi:MAG TPA: nucleotidyltransferase family protein [Ktedonobacterales bacterium]